MLQKGWDDGLLKLADASLGEPCQPLPDHFHSQSLEVAYGYCSRVTAIHSKSFFLASSLLPAEKRKAVRALYAFCRTTDDIVDTTIAGQHDVQFWRERALRKTPQVNDPVSIAWWDTRSRFAVPCLYANQLIEGVEQDLHVKNYASFDELVRYCYGVASTVGLMSMHIIGFLSEDAIRYAIRLGVALQLTNILRDVAEDYQRGRIYLPADELATFGITENHLRQGIADGRWKRFMKFQIERTRKIYQESWDGIRLLHPSGRLSIAAAATFYKDILRAIEDRDYDVFRSRAYISRWEKARKIPKLWLDYTFDSTPSSPVFTTQTA